MITNEKGLPQPLVDAVANDPYDKGGCDYSATELIAPPHQRILLRKHKDEIRVDASSRIWSLFGQSVHSVLERANGLGYVVERRYVSKFNIGGKDVTVGAKIDVLDTYQGILSDYKTTSVYKFKADPRTGEVAIPKEFEAQINIQAFCIFAETGVIVGRGQIVGILRDWRRSESLRESGYPKHMVETMEIPIWNTGRQYNYIAERLLLHMAPRPAPCSSEEMWERPDTWALMKDGQKRAVKLYPSEEAAASAVIGMGGQDNGYTIAKRQGARARCDGYCDVAAFCQQYQQYLGKSEVELPF